MSSKDRDNYVRTPPFSREYIIREAEALGEEVIGLIDLPDELSLVNFDVAFDEIIYPRYEIVLNESEDLGFDERGEKILGSYEPLSNTAFIDVSLKNDPRRTFTCWHEVGGHAILQGEWLRQELRRLNQAGQLITTETDLDLATTNILERQANLFAAHAGAPTALLYYALDHLLSPTRPIRYVGPKTYNLMFRGVWQWFKVDSLNHLCRILGKAIQWRFGHLSVEALSYRIQSLPIIQDISRPPFRLHRTAKFVPSAPRPSLKKYARAVG
jgi:hypothetical protein